MTTLTQGPLLGFDTETTGVNPFRDRIVTAALVGRGPAGTWQRTWLIDPKVEIPEQAAAIHGISTEYARANGVDAASALEEIAAELTAAFQNQIPVVAFNAAFDLTIIESELERHGLTTIGERLGRPLSPVVDPLVLDRALDRYRPGKRKLGDLIEIYGVKETGRLHTADADVAATLEVLAALATKHPELSAQDLDNLHAWQAGQHRAWATGFNKWRASQGHEGPGASMDWPLSRAEEAPDPAARPTVASGGREGSASNAA